MLHCKLSVLSFTNVLLACDMSVVSYLLPTLCSNLLPFDIFDVISFAKETTKIEVLVQEHYTQHSLNRKILLIFHNINNNFDQWLIVLLFATIHNFSYELATYLTILLNTYSNYLVKNYCVQVS